MADDSLLSLLTDIVDNKPAQPPQQQQQPQQQRFQQQPPSIPANLQQIPQQQQQPQQRRNALVSAPPIQNPPQIPNVHTGNPAFQAAMQAATANMAMPNVTMPPVATPQQQAVSQQQEAQLAQWRKMLPPEKYEQMEKLVLQHRTNLISKEEFQRSMSQFVIEARAYKQQQLTGTVPQAAATNVQASPAPQAAATPNNAELAKQVQAKALNSYVLSIQDPEEKRLVVTYYKISKEQRSDFLKTNSDKLRQHLLNIAEHVKKEVAAAMTQPATPQPAPTQQAQPVTPVVKPPSTPTPAPVTPTAGSAPLTLAPGQHSQLMQMIRNNPQLNSQLQGAFKGMGMGMPPQFPLGGPSVAQPSNVAASSNNKPGAVRPAPAAAPGLQPPAKKQRLENGPPAKRGRPSNSVNMVDMTDVTKMAGINIEAEDKYLDELRAEPASFAPVPVDNTPFLNKEPLKNKIQLRVKKQGLKSVSDEVLEFVSLAVHDRVRNVLEQLIEISKERHEFYKNPYACRITNEDTHQMVKVELDKAARIEADRKQKQIETDKKLQEKQAQEAELEKQKKQKKQKKLVQEEDKVRRATTSAAVDMAFGGMKLKSAPRNVSATQQANKQAPVNVDDDSDMGSDDQDEEEKQPPAPTYTTHEQAQQLRQANGSLPITIVDCLAFLDTEASLKKSHRLQSVVQNMKETIK